MGTLRRVPDNDDARPRVVVFAPAPMLTVTVEAPSREPATGEIHVHAGGQGFWVSRLLAELDVDVALCGCFGGESGSIVRRLIADADIRVCPVATGGTNGAYVHDRRHGERVEVAAMPATELSRHEVDELYGVTLTEALHADVLVLTGPEDDTVLPDDVYRRLAADVRANGGVVVADLSGGQLEAASEGGLTLLKVSEEDLERDGGLQRAGSLRAAAEELQKTGADSVVISLGDERSLVLTDGRLVRIIGPKLEPVETRGAGDSLTAGVAAGLARGLPVLDAARIGAAAGALNVTRHGLGSGTKDQIERLIELVTIEDVEGEP